MLIRYSERSRSHNISQQVRWAPGWYGLVQTNVGMNRNVSITRSYQIPDPAHSKLTCLLTLVSDIISTCSFKQTTQLEKEVEETYSLSVYHLHGCMWLITLFRPEQNVLHVADDITWKKNSIFWFFVSLIFVPRVQFTISLHWFKYRSNRWQALTWTKVNQFYGVIWHH